MTKVRIHATLAARRPAAEPPAARAVRVSHRAEPAACTQRDDRDLRSAYACTAWDAGPTLQKHKACYEARYKLDSCSIIMTLVTAS